MALNIHGPTLVYLVSVTNIACIVFLVMGVVQWRHSTARARMAKFAFVLAGIALYLLFLGSKHSAIGDLRLVAQDIQTRCNQAAHCPARMPGWESRDDRYSSMTYTNGLVSWPLLYRSKGEQFVLRLYIFLDMGRECSGGVGAQFICES